MEINTTTKEEIMKTVAVTHNVKTINEAKKVIHEGSSVTMLSNTSFAGFHTAITITEDGSVQASGIPMLDGNKVFTGHSTLTLKKGMMGSPETKDIKSAWVQAMTA